jgi:hypothetical protein
MQVGYFEDCEDEKGSEGDQGNEIEILCDFKSKQKRAVR